MYHTVANWTEWANVLGNLFALGYLYARTPDKKYRPLHNFAVAGTLVGSVSYTAACNFDLSTVDGRQRRDRLRLLDWAFTWTIEYWSFWYFAFLNGYKKPAWWIVLPVLLIVGILHHIEMGETVIRPEFLYFLIILLTVWVLYQVWEANRFLHKHGVATKELPWYLYFNIPIAVSASVMTEWEAKDTVYNTLDFFTRIGYLIRLDQLSSGLTCQST
jgi:hypothetical protein